MHKKLFLNAFRTALVIVLSFIVYNINVKVFHSLKNNYPHLNKYHFTISKIVKFTCIFLLDLSILYIYAYVFNALL
jgi:hypothetical protein